MKETWAFIYNPTSGSFSPRLLEQVQSALEKAGVSLQLMPTEAPGHATDLAAKAKNVQRVAVMGGDGTLNEAARGMLGRKTPLVFVPGGTANVMAHALKIGLNPVKAALLQLNAQPVPVFPGMIGKRCFLLMAGFGYDGAVVKGVSAQLKSRWGKGAYIWSGLKALLARRPAISVVMEDGKTMNADLVVVARSCFYAGSYIIHPKAGLTNSHLGLVAVSRGALPGFMLTNLGLGWHRRGKGIMLEMGTRMKVVGEQPFPAQVDGDFFEESREFKVEICDKPVHFCLPNPL